MATPGASLGAPPLLHDLELFMIWKKRFQIFVQAYSLRVWNVIEFGDYTPRIVREDNKIPRPKDHWSDEDKARVHENHIAMHLLYCALPDNQLHLVLRCDTAHDAWNTLLLIHEGNAELKNCKIRLLTQEFEALNMRKHETIDDMYGIYNHIIVSLKALGKTFTNERYVSKVLSSLHPKWDFKVNAIVVNKDLSVLSLEDLIGSLKAYEIAMNREDDVARSTVRKPF